jgi:hypothetical protein
MSDELNTLQETAATARAHADELKAALTDASTDEEKAAAEAAETAAVEAESAFTDAKKVVADAAGAAGSENGAEIEQSGEQVDAPKIGDACTCPDGRPGTVQAGAEENTLVCLPNQG